MEAVAKEQSKRRSKVETKAGSTRSPQARNTITTGALMASVSRPKKDGQGRPALHGPAAILNRLDCGQGIRVVYPYGLIRPLVTELAKCLDAPDLRILVADLLDGESPSTGSGQSASGLEATA
ncbi:MAG: hypothetical protein AAGJ81_01480 [Verrucomicrobiota bacterium]